MMGLMWKKVTPLETLPPRGADRRGSKEKQKEFFKRQTNKKTRRASERGGTNCTNEDR
jgi:hypothetical protein